MLVALIADDKQARLDTHASFLEAFGIQPFKALDIDSAKKMTSEIPCVDFAILDVNFDSGSGGNKEGLDYARELKDQGYPAYLAACSAYYADNPSVMAEVRSIFDGIIEAAPSVRDYEGLIEAAKAKKIEYLEKARLAHQNFLEQSAEDIVTFIDVHDFKIANSKVLSDEYVNYIKSGYKIKLVQPVYKEKKIGRSFLLWSRRNQEGVFLEVYKVPALFAYGESEEAALKMLNEIIVGMYKDSMSLSGQSEAWEFVSRIYEAK